MSNIKCGYYSHFKKKQYVVYGTAIGPDNEEYVLYRQDYEPYSFWVRPYNMFLDDVQYEGEIVHRFVFYKKKYKHKSDYTEEIIRLLSKEGPPIIKHSETEEEFHFVSISSTSISDSRIEIAPYKTVSSYLTDWQLAYRMGYERIYVNGELKGFKTNRELANGTSLSISSEDSEDNYSDDSVIDFDNISPSSIDLHISKYYFAKGRFKTIDLAANIRYATKASDLWKEIKLKKRAGKECIILWPGQTIITRTYEKIKLPDDCAGKIEIKSTYARLGLSVTASDYCNPGWNGYYPLTIKNNGAHRVVIHPKELMLQLCLIQTDGIIIRPYRNKATYWDDNGTPENFWNSQTVKRMKHSEAAIAFCKKAIESLSKEYCRDVDLERERLSDTLLLYFEKQLSRESSGGKKESKDVLKKIWLKYKKREGNLKLLCGIPVRVFCFIFVNIPSTIKLITDLHSGSPVPIKAFVWLLITLLLGALFLVLFYLKAPKAFCTLEKLTFESIYDKVEDNSVV